MSSEAKTRWPVFAAVIAVSAAIGFGAVYAMVGGGDNTAPPTVAKVSSDSLQNKATSKSAAAASDGALEGAGAVLAGAEGQPLNRGQMTTFVFKKRPTPINRPVNFNGPDGTPLTLEHFKGKVILLNLWATWCGPCRVEMPHLNTLQRNLGSDQFEVVALSVDRGSPDKSRAFLEEVGADALSLYHDPSAQAGFAMMAIGMPTTLLLDRAGREIGRLVGPAEWHSEDAKALIKAAIAAS